MFDLEQSIADWRKRMLVAGINNPVPLEELESHLRDEFESQMKLGLSETEAFQAAVQKIGAAQVVQSEFKKADIRRPARASKGLQTLFVVFASSIALSIGCMVLFKISFVARITLGLGLGFELPVVLLTLVRRGNLSYERLVGLRRYIIIWNLILGELSTTPEILTQVLMAATLQLLYEASGWIARYWERQAKKVQTI